MLILSMAVNLMVPIPLCLALLRDAPAMAQIYGPASPARGILTAIYIAIALASVTVLAMMPDPETARGFAVPLLTIQIVYKGLTWPLVGLSNVVTRFNLAIATLHAVTLWTLL